MRHFLPEEWADLARQVVAAEKKAQMQQHLEEGCAKCSRIYEIWQQVTAIAAREASYQPPEGVVRMAKASFAFQKPRRAGRNAKAIAQLILDSFRQPALAGVRGSVAAPQQLLYSAGQFLIDMRVEAPSESGRISVVGQVLDSADPHKGIDGIPVQLASGKERLAESKTNSFGEFHLEFEPHKNLQLVLEVGEQKRIFVPLHGFARQQTRKRER